MHDTNIFKELKIIINFFKLFGIAPSIFITKNSLNNYKKYRFVLIIIYILFSFQTIRDARFVLIENDYTVILFFLDCLVLFCTIFYSLILFIFIDKINKSLKKLLKLLNKKWHLLNKINFKIFKIFWCFLTFFLIVLNNFSIIFSYTNEINKLSYSVTHLSGLLFESLYLVFINILLKILLKQLDNFNKTINKLNFKQILKYFNKFNLILKLIQSTFSLHFIYSIIFESLYFIDCVIFFRRFKLLKCTYLINFVIIASKLIQISYLIHTSIQCSKKVSKFKKNRLKKIHF